MKNKLFIGIILFMAMVILQQACKINTENKQAGNSIVSTISDTAKSSQLTSTNVQHDTESPDKEKATHLQALSNEEVPDEPAPTQEELLKKDNGLTGLEKAPTKEDSKSDEIIGTAEQPAEFNGDINEYLKKNIRYPQIAKENNIEARVMLQFIIEKDGTIDKNTISLIGSNPGWGLMEEATRVVSNMPPWKPGKQNGKSIQMKYILPIIFKLP